LIPLNNRSSKSDRLQINCAARTKNHGYHRYPIALRGGQGPIPCETQVVTIELGRSARGRSPGAGHVAADARRSFHRRPAHCRHRLDDRSARLCRLGRGHRRADGLSSRAFAPIPQIQNCCWASAGLGLAFRGFANTALVLVASAHLSRRRHDRDRTRQAHCAFRPLAGRR
jgi:hypothetical protein